MSEMVYALPTLPDEYHLITYWIGAAEFGAAINLGSYDLRIIRHSFCDRHLLNSHVANSSPRSVKLRADERLRLSMGDAAEIAANFFRTRSPGVLPSSWPIEATLSKY